MSAPIHLLNPNDSALAEESLTRLLFEEASARAHFVRLGSTLSAITSRHAELAPCLLSLLGEMSAATTLLSLRARCSYSFMETGLFGWW